jgi:hypothetical protein
MQKQRKMTRGVCTALLALALASLAFAGSASAKLAGEYKKFEQCPYTNPEVKKCLYSPTEGGEVVLGNKKVPIVNTAVLQGGAGEANEITGVAKFYAAKNGITLSKAPQPVPGGLAGVVPDASSPFLVKALIKFFFENSLTGLNSTLELAKTASDIKVNEGAIGEEVGTALEMPVKVHLENPFLGKNCYIGSSTTPVTLKLTTGKTSPPAPNTSIKGFSGELELLEEGSILRLKNTVLVDNSFSAPAVTGCGGIISFLVNPIVSSQLGSTVAGRNTAILKNTVNVASAFAVNLYDKEHP